MTMKSLRIAYEDVAEEDLDQFDACGIACHKFDAESGFFQHSDFVGGQFEKWSPCGIINRRL